ncbi:zinc ribbon domain-containing protein [Streptomyces sp. NPDC055134]
MRPPLVETGRFEPTSQVCSTCGVKGGPKLLDVREWTCAACGAVHDRDVNAAINVKTAAGLAVSACGASVRPEPVLHSAKKQEATDSRPNAVPRSGTATIEKARILGLRPEVQVKAWVLLRNP